MLRTRHSQPESYNWSNMWIATSNLGKRGVQIMNPRN